jgi:hypothetical protein
MQRRRDAIPVARRNRLCECECKQSGTKKLQSSALSLPWEQTRALRIGLVSRSAAGGNAMKRRVEKESDQILLAAGALIVAGLLMLAIPPWILFAL